MCLKLLSSKKTIKLNFYNIWITVVWTSLFSKLTTLLLVSRLDALLIYQASVSHHSSLPIFALSSVTLNTTTSSIMPLKYPPLQLCPSGHKPMLINKPFFRDINHIVSILNIWMCDTDHILTLFKILCCKLKIRKRPVETLCHLVCFYMWSFYVPWMTAKQHMVPTQVILLNNESLKNQSLRCAWCLVVSFELYL